MCVFESAENETPRDTRKRKYDNMRNKYEDLERENQNYKEVLGYVLESEDNRAEVAKQRVDNRDISAIQAGIRGLATAPAPTEVLSPSGNHELLLTLLQSTCTLDALIAFKASVVSAGDAFHTPSSEAYRRLREGIVTVRHLERFFEAASTSHTSAHFHENSTDNAFPITFPNVLVHASPWVSDCNVADEVVSRSISLFLNHLNSYWRVLEDDLFLRDLRSRRVGATYCSPLLVNAILSYTSVCSSSEPPHGLA